VAIFSKVHSEKKKRKKKREKCGEMESNELSCSRHNQITKNKNDDAESKYRKICETRLVD
jgi:hypothetical protein